jgi:hypothetical protein
MSQHPLFPDPPVVTATVTVTVTQEHIDRATAEGLHPVSLALLNAVPGTEDADVINDGAYLWTGNDVTLLRFDRDGTAFVRACDHHEAVSPVTFQAEVIKP